MAKRIEKLALAGFRGATCPVEIEFDISKPAVMIFGENGTGKSTIVDAIDFVCNEKYGSLTERSSTRPKTHLRALGSTVATLGVSLTFDSQTWSASLRRNGPVSSGPDGRPAARILRRSQLLQIVNDQPRARYEALQDFIAVPGVQKSEQSLREAVKAVKGELNDAVVARQQAEETLEKLWSVEGQLGKGYLEWAKEKVQAKPVDLEAIVSSADQILSALNDATGARDHFEADKVKQSNDETELQKAQKALKEAEEEAVAQDRTLITVLQHAKNFLGEHSSTSMCPVCEREIDAKNLRARITDRLSEMQEIVSLKKKVDFAKDKAERAIGRVEQTSQRLVNSVVSLAPLVQKNTFDEISSLAVNWELYPNLVDEKPETKLSAVIEEARALLEIITACRIPLASRRDNAQKALNQLSAIQTHVETIQEKTIDTGRLNQLSTRLIAILEIVERQRKTYVEEVLASISQSVEYLYAQIHPGEPIGGIRLYLKPNTIGSLEFDSRFETETGIPPQAYYSDSHLDTLGVCVFLALAKYFKDTNTIVVLDDVVTSADQAHMERFIRVLHDEAKSFNQLVITTHYRPWRDKYLFARGPAANIQLIELLSWSLPRGIRHSKTKLTVEELNDYRRTEPMDRQIVASKSGILFESLLDHITLLYRCKLPRQTELNYTLGELLDSLSKKLKEAMKIAHVADDGSVSSELALESILNKLAGMTWIRNQVGCHWNVAGMSVSDDNVTLFADCIIELANILVCSSCGELPRRDSSGIYRACRCGEKRLYPLTAPA